MEINFLDLFSGIGGFSKGFKDAGFRFENHFFSEKDKHAIANYQYNFKKSKYVGPIEDVRGSSLGKVDIITFGSPCQDFSVAGKGQGLNGEQSVLIKEAIRLIIEKKPSFFIWENVKGAFSSNNSNDFWAIIQAFTNIGLYRLEWQLLNTLWIHPQSRERIYLIGHLATNGKSFKKIFPITEDDRLFEKTRQTTGSQEQTKHCGTLGTKCDRASNTFIKAARVSKKQQDRIYDVNGAMGCLNHNRCDDKTKIRIVATNKRSGDPQKGGTGLLVNESGNSFCIDTNNSQAIFCDEVYRKLTEIECERLQGFPDDWTKYGIYDKVIKKIASTNRYSLIGNAVTTDFPRYIAEKLKANYYGILE